MEDLATKTACRDGQSKTDKSPPAAHRIDSCLKSIKRWVPVDYKNETVQILKLAGPVVSCVKSNLSPPETFLELKVIKSATKFRMIEFESS